MIRLELLFAVQIGTAILMFLVLQKITQMKKQIDDILREVENYLQFISEQEEEVARPVMKKRKGEEEQNRIIQAVLGEYFP